MKSHSALLTLLLPVAALATGQPSSARERALDDAAALTSRILGELNTARAVSDLYRLYELREAVPDLTPLAATFGRVGRESAARPDVRATALEMHSQIAVAQGLLDQARGAIDRVAAVRSWAVIGPFENEGRAGFSAVYGPEKDGYDRAAKYAGKEHDVSWRTLDGRMFPLGFVELQSAISPNRNVAVYAATTLRASNPQGVVFHLGASGATKVWVNGRLVHQDTALHPSRFDQRSFPALLVPGDNLVLVKVAHAAGRLGFSLRVCDAADRPLTAMARAAHPPSTHVALAAPTEAPRRAPALPKVTDALDELREAARLHPEDARAQEDLAIAYAWRRPDDDGERFALHAMERASDAAPGNPQIELRLSHYEDRDANRRRLALERALAKAPRDAAVLAAMAALRLERNDPWGAMENAHQAVAADPTSADAALAVARALDAVGLTARAAATRLEIAGVHPALPSARRAAAAAQRRYGHAPDQEAELRAALALRFDDGEARADLTGLLLDRGDLDGALRLLGDAVALDPAAQGPRLRAAELLSQNGRKDEADRAYAEALRLSPDDADVHEALGRHRLRFSDDAGALAAFTRSLSLRPQNPSLRELLRTLRPEEQYASAFLYDAAALAKAKSKASDDDLEVLTDLTVTKVFANGLSSRTHQLVLRALTQRGVDQARFQSLSYSPDRQVVRVERARILRKDGTVLESRSDGERNVSEPWWSMYYDLRARVISFPQLEPGDSIELVTRLDDSGSNFFADYFGDLTYLQGTTRKNVADYVLLGPPGRTFYASATPLPRLEHVEKKLPDGGTLLRWTARDVPRLVPEPAMPGTSDLYAYVHVSTYEDWQGVARFYWGLVKDQLRVTDEIREAAQQATSSAAAADEMAKIRAVYDFVVSNTRYVALEFGIHSFKPYPVETILSRRFGDCKDKASLMHAMLESLGIDSRLVLLRTRRLGNLASGPASLAVFDHAILYVPKYDLYLDGTAEFHGSGELPPDDRGADALVVEPDGDGAHLRRTPDARPEDDVDETRASIALHGDGSASLDLAGKARGPWTAELRRAFEAPDDRRARAEEQLARAAFPGVKVTDVDVSDPHDIESPFVTRFRATAPGFAAPEGKGLRFSPFGQQRSFLEAYAQLSRRSLPQRLPAARKLAVSAEIALPTGWSAEIPADTTDEGPHGRYSVHYGKEPGKVTAHLELELDGGTVSPQEYPAFRAFLGRLDGTLSRKALAAPAPQTAASEGR